MCKGQGHGSKVKVAMVKNVIFYFNLCFDVIKRSKVKRVKVKGHKRSGSKVKVTINGKEKAGGLTPTSSCFILLRQGGPGMPQYCCVPPLQELLFLVA